MRASKLILSLRGKKGFTSIELMIAMAIVSTLSTFSIPVFQAAQNTANDHAALASIFHGHTLTKGVFINNGDAYPSTDQLVTTLSEQEPDSYTFRASQADVSVATGPRDISIQVDNWDTVTLCSKSTSGKAFCARFVDGSDQLQTGGYGISDSQDAVALGLGDLGEVDARAALPTVSAAPTADAGPTNTGQPVDIANPSGNPASLVSQSDQQGSSDAPSLIFEVGPPASTSATTATISWSNAGGPATTQSCILDGQQADCPLDTVTLSNLSLGSHSFEVDTSNDNGSDSITYTWTVTTPPDDRLVVRNNGDYATATGTFQPTGTFEVGAWVRLYAAPQGQPATIASEGCTWSNGTGCTNDGGWSFGIDQNMTVDFTVHTDGNGSKRYVDQTFGKSGNCAIDPSAKMDLTSWHFVSAAYDPAGRITTWIDGKLAGCSDTLGGLLPSIASGEPLLFGAQPNPAGNLPAAAFCNCEIGEFRATTGGAYANVSNPGPANAPGILSSPAENGRPASTLFHWSDWSDSTGNFADAQPMGGAHLASSDNG